MRIANNPPILSATGLVQDFPARGAGGRAVRAVDGVDLDVHEGETLAIVGESGSGKSTLARLLLALAQPDAGSVLYRGAELAGLGRAERRAYRRDVQAVFQDPAASLNPRMRVQDALGYVILEHRLATRENLHDVIAAQLATVELIPPEQFMTRFPHQLSGGQQQRVAIARAMALQPRMIIADEPLSSLDISVQTQLLELMTDLQRRTGVGFVLISHDLGAVESIADRVAVMYRGRIVELGRQVLSRPRHPYTQALLDAKLIADPRAARARRRIVLTGDTAATGDDDPGCAFRPRCAHAMEVCATISPALEPVTPSGDAVACHLPPSFHEQGTP